MTKDSRLLTFLRRWVNIEPAEIGAVVWSFLYFFTLLSSYYILRPMRDAMGIEGGVENLDWLFTGTFVVMLAVVPLFGWAASRFPRKKLVPYIYLFFVANILVFYVLFESDLTTAWVARGFFIWVSVYNLFVVSVFWSFMTDLFSDPQAKRLFGFIAAGGTTGALVGPALTAFLAVPLGPNNLLLVSAVLLAASILCIRRLVAWTHASTPGAEPVADVELDDQVEEDKPIGGGIFAGIPLVMKSPYLLGICLLILIYTTLATFLYFQQAEIIRDAFEDSAMRTTVFAAMDFAVNALTLLVQFFLTAKIVKRIGLSWTLAVIPIGLGIGFIFLGAMPILAVLVTIQVLRRAGNFSIMKPAREMLYVVLGREEKYKAKNFIDTVVYRGGDAVSAWAYSGLQAIGLSLSAIAFVAVPLAAFWAWISFGLGKKNRELAKDSG